ncbi:unnamed protein product [Blepharisma stoltei]|uniref:Uncharacterized protein n=1 Tax=Blepharisma stoltei TaxID=1481888 RepID=A0AAU9JPW0_9CILI|nr:unnamed protein product [Blepharisma stoltei]
MDPRHVQNASHLRYPQEHNSFDMADPSINTQKSFLPMIIKSSKQLEDNDLPKLRSSLESVSTVINVKAPLKSFEIDISTYRRNQKQHNGSISPRSRIYPTIKKAKLQKIGYIEKPDFLFESDSVVLPVISPLRNRKDPNKVHYFKPSHYKQISLDIRNHRDYRPKMISIAVDTSF